MSDQNTRATTDHERALAYAAGVYTPCTTCGDRGIVSVRKPGALFAQPKTCPDCAEQPIIRRPTISDQNTRATTDTLGHALATGVLRGHKGWVWCGSESVPAVTGGDADGCWPNDDGWFKSGCPGPHTPLYSGPHRSAEQPIATQEDGDV